MKLTFTPSDETKAVLALSDTEALEVMQDIARQLLNHEPVEIYIFDDEVTETTGG